MKSSLFGVLGLQQLQFAILVVCFVGQNSHLNGATIRKPTFWKRDLVHWKSSRWRHPMKHLTPDECQIHDWKNYQDWVMCLEKKNVSMPMPPFFLQEVLNEHIVSVSSNLEIHYSTPPKFLGDQQPWRFPVVVLKYGLPWWFPGGIFYMHLFQKSHQPILGFEKPPATPNLTTVRWLHF